MDIIKSVTVLVLICLSWTTANQNRTSPRLEFSPLPKANGSTLIRVDGRSEELLQPWIDSLKNLLEPYYRPPVELRHFLFNCHNEPPPKGGVCDVDTRDFGPCERGSDYGYKRGTPCIFLRLNDLPKRWRPQPYNTSNVPKEMPEFLKKRIQEESERKKVWVSCDGESANDRENVGPVIYYPHAGFPANYYEGAEVENFPSPLVAVQFERAASGVVINVSCTAWAANIPRGAEDKLGTARFQLKID